MLFSELADVYEELESTPSKLKKAKILSALFSKTPSNILDKVVLMVQGRVYPEHSSQELGVADKMMIRAIAKAGGFKDDIVVDMFKKTGDLGLTAEECIGKRRQSTLSKKSLTIEGVFSTVRKLADANGQGSQERKLGIISELLVSARPKEARYIARMILSMLRVGTAEGIIRDAIRDAFLSDTDKEEASRSIEHARNILSDLSAVAKLAKEKGVPGLSGVGIVVGRPLQVMLAEKAESISDVIKKYKKVFIEWKFDGMRVQIHKKGNDVWIYTRRLEDVTKQFPDIVDMVRKSVKSDDCVIEGEALGISKDSRTPLPFQTLSQRIHRKHGIADMAKQIPVQVNLFDVIYSDGKSFIETPFSERRKILSKMVTPVPGKFVLAKQIITEDVKEAEAFYKSALDAKQEGVMIKVMDSPYVFGRHVDGWVKIKPTMENLDLVIVGATWGEGARANWLTSYVLACRDPDTGKFLECGMMSTGLTEEEYDSMTRMIKPLIVSEKGKDVVVRPKIVLEVSYQEIQKSTNYDSGFALRFPAFQRLREDKGPDDADAVERVEKLYKSQGRAG